MRRIELARENGYLNARCRRGPELLRDYGLWCWRMAIPMVDPYIRARDVSKRYKSGAADLVVFSDLNLDIERGEMLALVGESGAGKSTLLHLLGGLDRPSSGTIHYGSREISGLAHSAQS